MSEENPDGLRHRAFVGCHRHGSFDYYCQSCLVATVAKLCDLLDSENTATPT